MLKKLMSSTLGKKFLMALTGLALGGFVITHLAANLLLLKKDGTTFNLYARNLELFGVWLLIAEAGLLAMLIAHVITAYGLKFLQRRARPVSYHVYRSKGGPSKGNVGSRHMWLTGTILLGFLVLHIWQFKFGPSQAQGYIAQAQGEQIRDLHRLVIETFHNPLWVVLYVAVMVFLGAHLRHGYWSLFQSLGVAFPKISKPLHTASFVLAGVLAVGFLLIPLWVYFDLWRIFS